MSVAFNYHLWTVLVASSLGQGVDLENGANMLSHND